jgi:PAS domain S-box-containing protein
LIGGPELALRLQGLALVALQLQLERGEIGAALHRLVGGVADLCHGQVLLCVGTADTPLLARACSPGASLPSPGSGEALLLQQALQAQGALSYGGWLAVPVQRYGVTLGVLALDTGGAVDLGALASQIDPVVSALASLLAHGADTAAAVDRSVVPTKLLRTALRESGTFVWEWDLPTDALADIDEGAQMLGYGKHELGHTQKDWNRIIHPDDLEPIEQSFQAHVRGEREVFDHVYRARARDGTWHWVQERGRIVEWCADGSPRRMIGTQTDVSGRVGLQVDARELVQRLRRIARQVPGVLFQYRQVPRRRGQFEYVSERSNELFGVDPATLMGDALQVFGRVETPDMDTLRLQAARCAELGVPLRAEFTLARAGDGAQVWLRCNAQCQPLDGGGAVWHGYVEDITEQRELEVARQQTLALQASNRAKTEFLARMSHELRTPLNAVLGFAQLLLRDPVEPPSSTQRARLARIHDAGEHLLGMIGDLLDLTHLETGRLALLAEAVPLTDVVRHCVELMQPLAEGAGLSLSFEPDATALVHVDRLRLQQIVLNLLSNAIKYNRPQGWVRLSCAVSPGSAQARLDVVDSGLGLAPEQLAHLFEPFNRLGRDYSGGDGTGIGLALSRTLADMMGGSIEVHSEPQRGSTFSLLLPLYDAAIAPD